MRQLGLENCWEYGLPLLWCYFIEAAEVGCASDLGQFHSHNFPFWHVYVLGAAYFVWPLKSRAPW
jgi:hypothetical protein